MLASLKYENKLREFGNEIGEAIDWLLKDGNFYEV